MFSLIEWARKTLNVNGFFLRVMDDNAHAIRFYETNGFTHDIQIPLVKLQQGEMVVYRPSASDETVDKYFLRMVWSPSVQDAGQTMILTAGPSVTAREGIYAYDAAMNGWNRNWSGYLTKLEQRFADYIGVKYAWRLPVVPGHYKLH